MCRRDESVHGLNALSKSADKFFFMSVLSSVPFPPSGEYIDAIRTSSGILRETSGVIVSAGWAFKA